MADRHISKVPGSTELVYTGRDGKTHYVQLREDQDPQAELKDEQNTLRESGVEKANGEVSIRPFKEI